MSRREDAAHPGRRDVKGQVNFVQSAEMVPHRGVKALRSRRLAMKCRRLRSYKGDDV